MDDFQKQFDIAIVAYASRNQYGVSSIPAHTHNGTDSLRVDIANISRFPSNPSDGDTIVFDSATNQWLAQGSSSSAPVFWRVGTALGAGQTQYVSNSLASTTESNAQVPCPVTGTISSMYILIATAQPVDASLVLTFRKSGADTSLVVTVPASSGAWTVYSDITHSFSVTAGDLIDVKAVNNSASTSASISQVIFKVS